MNLYEMVVTKVYEDTETSKRMTSFSYQVTAESEWSACATVGQIFNGSEYSLRIESLKLVGNS